MKKLGALVGLVIILGMAAGICIWSVSYAESYNYGQIDVVFGGGKVELYNIREFDVQDINNIKLKYKSPNIIFLKGQDKIVIKEYLRKNRKNAEAAMEVVNGTLQVNGGEKGTVVNIFAFNTQSERIEVYLPDTYINAVEVIVTSGNIKADEAFHFKEFHASANSGNIFCENITADVIEANTTSGNIRFGLAQGERIMSASSGNIHISKGEGSTSIKTASGGIRVENAAGSLRASAASGNISVDLIRIEESIEIGTTSGNISIEIPKESAFSYEGSAASGSIRTDFDEFLTINEKKNRASGAYGGNSLTEIHTSAASGNTAVRFR